MAVDSRYEAKALFKGKTPAEAGSIRMNSAASGKSAGGRFCSLYIL